MHCTIGSNSLFLEEIEYVMSLLKTQYVNDNDTNLEEKKYRDDHEKLLYDCYRRPNARSSDENYDIGNDIRDFHLRGTYILKNMLG